ncbi:MAG: Flp pilus assembly protein CpaB [Rhodomicrobiaceae bacterium]
MQWARGLVLLLAAGSAVGAGVMVRRSMTAPVSAPELRAPVMAEILVAGRAIAAGEAVRLADLRWQAWPPGAAQPAAYRRKPGTSAPDFKPAIARYPLAEGEPVVESKLVRPGEGGVMAALIAPGKRAVAVPVREESAAGGLIQPNDRVDLVWTPQRNDRPDTRMTSRMLLSGVKILAIGQSLDGQSRSAKSRTATLELTPGQARIVAGALAAGEISLALISAADIAALPDAHDTDEWNAETTPGVKILRFGR